MSSSGSLIVGVPVVSVHGDYYVSPHFGRAPFIAFVEVTGDKYRVLEVVENPYARHERRRGAVLIEFMASRGVKSVIVLGVGYGAYYGLRERGIKVYYVPLSKAGQVPLTAAIEMFINKQLEEATEPRELE